MSRGSRPTAPTSNPIRPPPTPRRQLFPVGNPPHAAAAATAALVERLYGMPPRLTCVTENQFLQRFSLVQSNVPWRKKIGARGDGRASFRFFGAVSMKGRRVFCRDGSGAAGFNASHGFLVYFGLTRLSVNHLWKFVSFLQNYWQTENT